MLRPTGGTRFVNQQCEVCRPKPTHPAVVLAAVKDAARRWTRWAEDGPILDCRCARRPLGRAAGAEEWLPPGGRTKELEKEEKRWKRMKIALDNERPIQGFRPPQ